MTTIEDIDGITCDAKEDGQYGRYWDCTASTFPDGDLVEEHFYAEGFEQFDAAFSSNLGGRYESSDITLSPFPNTGAFTRCRHRDGVSGNLEKRVPVMCERQSDTS